MSRGGAGNAGNGKQAKIENFLAEYDQQQFDQKLRILLIQFFREQRLPYSTVDNPRLQEIIRFLNPTVNLPNFDNLLKVGVNYHDKFIDHETSDMFHKLLPLQLEANQIEIPLGLGTSRSSYEVTGIPPLKLARLPEHKDFLKLHQPIGKLVHSNDPCVVCLEKREWSRKRKLTRSEATVFSFVCVIEKVYPIEIAQRLFELKTTCSCVDHLKPVYDETLRILGITSSEQLPKIPQSVISDAYALINKIRNPNYDEVANSMKPSAPFRHTLFCFFKNYDTKVNKMTGFKINPLPRAPQVKRIRESSESSSSATYSPHSDVKNELSDFPEDFLEQQDS